MACVVPRVTSVQYIRTPGVCIGEARDPSTESLLGDGIAEKNNAWPRPNDHCKSSELGGGGRDT